MIYLFVGFCLCWFVCVIVLPTLVHRHDQRLKIEREFKLLNLPTPADSRWAWGHYGEYSLACGPINVTKDPPRIAANGLDILNLKARPRFERRILERSITQAYHDINNELLNAYRCREDLKRKEAMQVFINYVSNK
jgi:hypothetical protein